MHMGTWVPRVTTAWGPAAGCADLHARVPGVCGVGRRGGLFQKDRAQMVHSLEGQRRLPSVGGRGPCGAGLGSLEEGCGAGCWLEPPWGRREAESRVAAASGIPRSLLVWGGQRRGVSSGFDRTFRTGHSEVQGHWPRHGAAARCTEVVSGAGVVQGATVKRARL